MEITLIGTPAQIRWADSIRETHLKIFPDSPLNHFSHAKKWIQNQKKLSYVSILIANLKRIEESLRVLEECSKIVTPNFVRDFQALRFRIYELEKKTLTKF